MELLEKPTDFSLSLSLSQRHLSHPQSPVTKLKLVATRKCLLVYTLAPQLRTFPSRPAPWSWHEADSQPGWEVFDSPAVTDFRRSCLQTCPPGGIATLERTTREGARRLLDPRADRFCLHAPVLSSLLSPCHLALAHLPASFCCPLFNSSPVGSLAHAALLGIRRSSRNIPVCRDAWGHKSQHHS